MGPAAAKEAKSAADEGVKKIIPAPAEGKGQIVFFRPGGMGFALGCGVNENGVRLSALGAGKYFILPADPGSHSYTVKSEATDLLTLEVEPGETYYAVSYTHLDVYKRQLERCGVKTEILGFTTRTWKGGQSREDWLAAGRPPHPGRLNDLRHICLLYTSRCV